MGESVGDEVSQGPERAAHNAKLRPMRWKIILPIAAVPASD